MQSVNEMNLTLGLLNQMCLSNEQRLLNTENDESLNEYSKEEKERLIACDKHIAQHYKALSLIITQNDFSLHNKLMAESKFKP